jgi:hypothetical protein
MYLPFGFLICLFIVKKLPLYVNFSIFPCGILFFSPSSTLFVGVRFCRHAPNSTKNKIMKSGNPYLHKNMVF